MLTLLGDEDRLRWCDAATASQTVVKSYRHFLQLITFSDIIESRVSPVIVYRQQLHALTDTLCVWVICCRIYWKKFLPIFITPDFLDAPGTLSTFTGLMHSCEGAMKSSRSVRVRGPLNMDAMLSYNLVTRHYLPVWNKGTTCYWLLMR